MRSCAKSTAIMVVRFHPKESLFFSATSIAKVLEAMDHGNSGSLFAAVDSIKLGLKSPIIRKALSPVILVSKSVSFREERSTGEQN